ncbi:Nuclear receptor subfamily 1 group I member 2 [Takifugu flavidus]|uniref:Cilia- and flagella-associated protein 91 n=1 Tax=Takifugu flavidus TaxID=433684 RepID=A0A5C6PNF1_9TELE|nr:Nuclear receptor subfamily 1 group I member 2 [Takifugu flavidus]
MIQHQQAKRALEATLPPLDDLSQLDKRRKMMEEIEAQDWAFREAEIQKLHEERHAVSVDLLKQRVMSQEKATNQTLNKLYSKIQNEKEKRQQAIHDDYMRSLRKLESKRQTAKEKILQLEIKHSVANETWLHTDFSTNESAYNDYIKSHYLQEYSGCHPPMSRNLKTYKALKKEIEQVEEKPLRFLVKKEKPVPRPATPTVHEPPEGEEEEECAIIFIQKLLRGRKVQCEMLQGIEDRMDLIRELQTVHALQEEEQELQDADRDFVLSLKEQRDKARHQTLQEETSEAGAMGAELHHLLDTLSKELIRLQEERRIHALVLLAERDRRLREAEESGRRQVEERRRREEDQIFRQVVQVHQETVDLYLEDIILDTLENTTDQRAREDIHRRAQEVNRLAFTMEESRNRLQSEEIVSELVYSFLIPEIEKMSFRQKVHQRQQRHLQAARDIIQERVEHAGNHPGSLGSSQLSGPSEGASSQDRRISRVDEEQEVRMSGGFSSVQSIREALALRNKEEEVLGDEEPRACGVCGDQAKGYHFNAWTCEGCKGFFSMCVLAVIMSEKEIMERRIRLKRKKMLNTPIHLSSQQEETIRELLYGHRKTFDLEFYRFSSFRPMDRNIFAVRGSSPSGPASSDVSSLSTSARLRGRPETPQTQGGENARQGCVFTALPHVTDLATCMIHDIIAFSKSLTDFKSLLIGDQIALLKGATFEVMEIRFNMVFNTKTGLWECGHATYCIEDAVRAGFQPLFLEPLLKFHHTLRNLGLEEEEYVLMQALSLFSPDRPGVQQHSVIDKIHENLALALKTRIELKRTGPEKHMLYPKVLSCLTEMRTMNEEYSKQVLQIQDIQPNVIPPLLMEMVSKSPINDL